MDLKNKILTTLILSNEDVNQDNINKTRPIVLNSLIDLIIKEEETKKYKISASQTEIQNNLNVLSKNNLDNFKKKFLLNNLNFEIYYKDLETELKWRKLIYYLYKKKVSISDSEINLELNKILNEEKVTDYKLKELMISFVDKKDKEKKILKISKELEQIGFEKVLLKYNKAVNQSNLGELGWVNSKSLSKNILSNIQNLKINDISSPIDIDNNLLYLKIIDIRKSDPKLKTEDVENIKKNILNTKENQRFMLYSNSHLSKLKNLATIEYK